MNNCPTCGTPMAATYSYSLEPLDPKKPMTIKNARLTFGPKQDLPPGMLVVEEEPRRG